MCKYVLTRIVHKINHLVSFNYRRYFQIEVIFITMKIICNLQKPKTTYLSVKEHQRKHEHCNNLENLQCTCKGYKYTCVKSFIFLILDYILYFKKNNLRKLEYKFFSFLSLKTLHHLEFH
jgi:hypothetical protein